MDDYFAMSAAALVGIGPIMALVRRLLNVNDAFKLREELALAIGIGAAIGGKYDEHEPRTIVAIAGWPV